MITSLTNERVKELVKLNTSKGRKEAKLFIVEGKHLVSEAKALGIVKEIYTIDENLEGTLVSEAVMRKICNTNTVVSQIAVCNFIEKNELSSRILILDSVQDPGNLGTLMRSAVSFGFNTLFLSNGTVDPYNDKVIRSSQGAIFKLNIIIGDIIEFIKSLNDYDIYSTNVVNGIDVRDINVKKNIAVILGNEGNGISDDVNNLNLKNIYIKMNNMESLNVAVAGSIIMYEISKK